MQKYGFREGQGLGKHEQGLSTALSVEKTSKRGGKIIVGEVTEKGGSSPERGTCSAGQTGPHATGVPEDDAVRLCRASSSFVQNRGRDRKAPETETRRGGQKMNSTQDRRFVPASSRQRAVSRR